MARAIGIDLTLENRGMLVNSVIQYTYSVAKANGEYDQATFGNAFVDAPSQEYMRCLLLGIPLLANLAIAIGKKMIPNMICM